MAEAIKSKYTLDRNDYGDLYIQKHNDPDTSLMDINRIIVNAEDLRPFLKFLSEYLVREFELTL